MNEELPVRESVEGALYEMKRVIVGQDAMLERLKALSDEHFGYSPDEINWGDVGTLAHYAQLLKRITDAAFKEGEYAG